MAAAILAMKQTRGFSWSRFLSGLIFLISTALVLGIVLYAQSQYGEADTMTPTYALFAAVGLAAIIAAFALWGRKLRVSLGAAFVASILFMGGTFGYVLPQMKAFNTSERLALELRKFSPKTPPANIHSPQYSEPSLVYHVGTEVNVKGQTPDFTDHDVIILDLMAQDTRAIRNSLTAAARTRNRCVEMSNPVTGFNYSKGDELALVILKEGPC